MAKKTVEVYVCDYCHKEIRADGFGFRFGASSALLTRGQVQEFGNGKEVCVCKACLKERFPEMTHVETRVETRTERVVEYVETHGHSGGATGRPLLCDGGPVVAGLVRGTAWST